MTSNAEKLKDVMRFWTTGVSVVTSAFEGQKQGITVNSFISISLDPALVVVTLAKRTKTHTMVQDSGKFGVSLLSQAQVEISNIFAGKIPESEARFETVPVFYLDGEIPLIKGGLANLLCAVRQKVDLAEATMFIGEVLETEVKGGVPLVYHHREYRTLEEK